MHCVFHTKKVGGAGLIFSKDEISRFQIWNFESDKIVTQLI